MIQAIRNRLNNREEGFTLIELMVVVLIIAILIAIAIPTFLGARERAQDRAAQSSLRNAVTAAKTIFTDNEDYTAATPAALSDSEPSYTFDGTSATDANAMAVNTPDVNTFQASVLSRSGKCFALQDVATAPSGGTTFAVDTSGLTEGGCDAFAAGATYTSDGW